MASDLHLVINHQEATELAETRQEVSNLARCYLDLKRQVAAYQRPLVSMVCCPYHQGQALKFVFSAVQHIPSQQACPGCQPELFNIASPR